MITEIDQRDDNRRLRDEQIAAEPQLEPLEQASGRKPTPIEAHLARRHKPVAVAGIVENGLVRPLDPAVKLAEHTRVIIIATEAS